MKRCELACLPALLMLALSVLSGCAHDAGGGDAARAVPRAPGESHFATYLKYRAGENGAAESLD